MLDLGVTDLDEGGEALLPTFSREPLEPNDCKKFHICHMINTLFVILLNRQAIMLTWKWPGLSLH